MYTGTLIADTIATVERVTAESQVPDLIATVDAILSDSEALRYLIGGRVHLTDNRTGARYPVKSRWPEMDEHDMAAWSTLGSLQFCIESGQTKLCSICGEMQGQHSEWGEFCRDQRHPRHGTYQGIHVVSNRFEPFADGRRA